MNQHDYTGVPRFPVVEHEQAGPPSAKDEKLQSSPTWSSDVARVWTRGWTPEIVSCLFAIASLGGLVATLKTHEGRPLPGWPQLVTINSIVSIFSMMIRASVGLVLAEGMRRTNLNTGRRALTCFCRHQSIQVAMVPPTAAAGGHGALRLCQSRRLGFYTSFESTLQEGVVGVGRHVEEHG